MHEIESPDQLADLLRSGAGLAGARVVGLDLTAYRTELLQRRDWQGSVILGGRLPADLDRHVRAHGALVFPADPTLPVDPYRSRLYAPEELYAGLDAGYAATPDARAYAWTRDPDGARDAYVTMVRAIHDDAMSDALDETLDGLPVVGVMGGHDLSRSSRGYAAAAHLGHRLADAGLVVVTGGGPGAMEAANLGAVVRQESLLDGAIARLADVPTFAPDVAAWARVALDVRAGLGLGADARVRSVGIPTWFYGHEPPNVFCDGVAKYFSNATREDGLLSRSRSGVVVLPGAAGTVQEVFQAVTPLYYAPTGATLPPLVLVGRDHWRHVVPVWEPLVTLAAGRAMADAVHLVDDIDDAVSVVVAAATGGSAG